ncbi:MAG: ATP-binding protein [Chloroflexota bacterium]|nr:ATP-binding protein [Chloroflexota bacterium]
MDETGSTSGDGAMVTIPPPQSRGVHRSRPRRGDEAARDDRTPASAMLYIVGLALAACGLALVALAHAGPLGRERALLALVGTGCVALAGLYPLPFAARTKLYLDTSVLFAAVLLFEPGIALLIAGAGTLLAHLVRRQPWDQTIFNTAQAMIEATVGALVLAGAGWQVDPLRFDQPAQVLLIPVAGAAIYLVNTLSVATIVGLQAGRPPLQVWSHSLLARDRAEPLAHLAQLGLGLLTAGLVDAHVWMLPLLALPAVVVHRALTHQEQLRQRLEATLRSSEANLAAAQRIAHLGSWEWDLAIGEQCWSDELYRIFGFAPAAAAPTPEAFVAAAHPVDRPTLEGALGGALDGQRSFGLDYRVRRPDGAERIVHARGEVVEDEAGRRLVGTVQDVTERKEADELKAALLAVVSHELRTPLATIKASTTSLLDPTVGWAAETRTEFVQVIDQEADRLARMVGNLLDLSRIEGGALRPEKEWYDIPELLADAATRLAGLAPRHRVTTDVEPNLPLARFDYVQIAQVLANLGENAVKYTPLGTTVTLSARLVLGAIELAVADDGPGVSASDLPHIFEKFFRADHTGRIAGTGIGLTISKGLVEAHGGRIWAESRAGRGLTVRFVLPCDDASEGLG